jgi:class 3 adenylate cyclase/predicted ATPase
MPVFAFTDIEGSTGLWEKHQGAMGPIIAKHYAILEDCVAAHGGRIIKKTGDGIFALFPDESPDRPSPGLSAALAMQQRFQAEHWPVIGELRVRMGFHCGEAEEMAGDYYGPTANRTARFMSLGWGGQILVSSDLKKQARLPEGAQWVDLGVHQVKDLPEPQHVFSLTHPSLALQEFPPLKSLSNRPHNLPEQMSPFFGREPELKALEALLAGPHSRLITVLGAGGVGKTRLAIQAAQAALPSFKHGATLVELDGLGAAEQLPGRIAAALKLGLYRGQDPRAQVLDYLKDKQLLLILDPAERLGAATGWVAELLEACPSLRILACSRRRLDLRSESLLALKGLDLPGTAQATPAAVAASACARLFVQQVQGLQQGYALKPEDSGAFLRLGRALQGLPVGLELAAGMLRALPLAALAERVEKDPRFLASTRQDLPPAHRSLKALFESSWDLCSDPEKGALARLSAVRGSFAPAMALALLQARPETLAGLADLGLLEAVEGGRYALADGARPFAAAKLDEHPAQRDEVLDLLARHYCRFMKERERGLLGHDQARAIAEVRQEFPNIHRAWDRAVEQGWLRELGQAARCLGLFADMQGLARDWEPRMEKALALFEAPPQGAEALPWEEAVSAQASLLANQANFLFSLGRSVEARERMDRSLALFKKAGNRGGAAYALVRTAIFMGPEDERRRPALEEAAALFQAQGDANGAAWARRNLGYMLCLQGRVKEGQPLVEDGLAVFRKVGNQREIAWSLNSLGQVALEAGQDEAGAKGLREARDLFLGIGDLETAAWTLNTLGRAALRRRRWAEARASFEESLKLFGQIRHFRGRALALRSLCETFFGQGDFATAYVVVDKAIAEAQAVGDGPGQAGALMQKGQLLAGQQRYDEALALLQAAQAAFAKGGSQLGQALALEAQGSARLRQGQGALARGLYDQACQAFAQHGLRDGEARICVRLGDLDVAEGKPAGGEAWYLRALKVSRQSKPGDYSLGALLGQAAIIHKQGRKLEALHLALLCERALVAGLMQASEAEFYADLGRRAEVVLAQIGSKLLQSVIEEARAKMAEQDARALLKDALVKFAA